MIPIRDINPTRTKPVLLWILIGLNVALFLFEFSLGAEAMQAFVERFGLVPNDVRQFLFEGVSGPELRPLAQGRYLTGSGIDRWELLTPVTSMFLHGGWMHLIGNMWFLWVFGDNLEDTLGRGRFLAFYLLSGLGAALAQFAIAPHSPTPMVGASGAISGVLAGYVMLFPHARVVTLVPIFFFFQFLELPAYVFIFIWFGFQLLSGYFSLGALGDGQGGVAFFAHIGGFLSGILLVRPFLPRRVREYMRRIIPRRSR